MQMQFADTLARFPLTAALADTIKGTRATNLLQKGSGAVLRYGAAIVEGVAYVVGAMFLALYFLLDRDRMRGGLFALVPRSYHLRLANMLAKSEVIVGGYLRGQIITSILCGLFAFGVLAIARVPNALAIGAFAALADVLPYIGAFLVVGPAFLLALHSTSLTVALIVAAVLAASQELESRVLVPRIYGRALRLPSAVVMIALLFGAKLLGIVGALLALPVAAAIRMIVEELRVDLPGEPPVPVERQAKEAIVEAVFELNTAGLPAASAAAVATRFAEARQQAAKKVTK